MNSRPFRLALAALAMATLGACRSAEPIAPDDSSALAVAPAAASQPASQPVDAPSATAPAAAGQETQPRTVTLEVATDPAGADLFLAGEVGRTPLGKSPYTHTATLQVQRQWGEGPDQYFIVGAEGASYELLLPDGSARTIVSIQAEKDGKTGEMVLALDAHQVWANPAPFRETIVLK